MVYNEITKDECQIIADYCGLRVKNIVKNYDDNFDSCITRLLLENDNFEIMEAEFFNRSLMKSEKLSPRYQKLIQKAVNTLNEKVYADYGV